MKKSLHYTDDNNPHPSELLTIEELRTLPGFEKISEKEAEEVITSLYQLSQIAFQAFIEEQNRTLSKTDIKEEISR